MRRNDDHPILVSRPGNRNLPTMELPLLTGDQAVCLDVLLVEDNRGLIRGLVEVLTEAGVQQSSGRAFTIDAVTKRLREIGPPVNISYGYVKLTSTERPDLLLRRSCDQNSNIGNMASAALRIKDRESQWSYYHRPPSGKCAALALVANDYPTFREHYNRFRQSKPNYLHDDPRLLQALLDATNRDFWLSRTPPFQRYVLSYWSDNPDLLHGEAVSVAVEILRKYDFLGDEHYRLYERCGIRLLDRVVADEEVRKQHFDLDQLCRLATGQPVDPQLLRERLEVVEGEPGFIDFTFLAAAYSNNLLEPKEVSDYLVKTTKNYSPLAHRALLAWADSLNGHPPDEAEFGERLGRFHYLSGPEAMVILWVSNWLGLRPPEEMLKKLLETTEICAHLPWIYGELRHALATLFSLNPDAEHWRTEAAAIAERHGFTYLLAMHPCRPRWESALREVEKLVLPPGGDSLSGAAGEKEPARRTIWIVDIDGRELYPKEQKLGQRGYSKGRKLKWDELFSPANRRYREAEDLNAIHGLRYGDGRPVRMDGYLNDDYLVPHFERMLFELAGHPRLLLGERQRLPLHIGKGEAGVTVEDQGDTLRLRFDPPAVSAGNYQLKKITPTRYRVYHLSDRQLALAKSIGYGLDVPAAARERLEATLEGMRGEVSIQSDTDLLRSELPTVEGSDRISVHLMPLGEGYHVELLARPLPDLPLYFPPGEGLSRSLAAGEDGRRILVRDLAGEQAAARLAIEGCPSLGTPSEGSFQWRLEDERTTLAFLLELRNLVAEDRVEVQYPKGQTLRLTGQVDFDDIKLRVGKKREWFEVSGEVRVERRPGARPTAAVRTAAQQQGRRLRAPWAGGIPFADRRGEGTHPATRGHVARAG